MTAYPDAHWAEIARYVNDGRTIADIQNHYPHATYQTVQRWIRVCRDRGLLTGGQA